MNPLVSIIVPIYNAEKTLPRCIDSILAQDYRDFELYLMDDGSSDSSGKLCDSYAEADPRIHVIHKPNSGVSDTRNQALSLALGTYIQFLDSDDWITPDATRLFVRAAESAQCDLVIADFYRVVGERLSHKGDIEEETVMTREEYAQHMLENPADFYYGVLWNKLYRRDIIEKYQIRMDPQVKWCEDFLFNMEYIRHANRFLALQSPVYYYVRTKGSLVSQGMRIDKVVQMKLSVFDYYREFFRDVYSESDYESMRPQIYSFFLASAMDNVVLPSPLPGSKKLGEERPPVHTAALSADTIVGELYRYRKLLDHYCQSIAASRNLTMEEIQIMLYCGQPIEIHSLEELSDLTGLTRRECSSALRKLQSKKLLRLTNGKAQSIHIALLPSAEPILKALDIAQKDFDRERFYGFSEEELASYEQMSEKTKNNILTILAH